ncbi:MarR family winged helix-turn-helix transcriptional regulator [Sphingomonas jeddahensis]|uniref:Transcriptional regulator SlyA n=1 Tax=Sphingomonas jeddahensis TaxID=1915074 RepID=A0A1V2EWN9_9SPHN|nr:MarR family transcriptional regulator [Sphingomonas jeddahensis]ONF97086.1 Transcriptional regulator SlyA [Sphingomonas jeddahensis]
MSRTEHELRIATMLNPLAQAWRAAADAMLGELGIKSAAAWCLVHLARLGPNVRQTELADAIGISDPSLARTIAQVVADGLVERRIDENDRRSNLMCLTVEGAALAKAAEERLAGLRADLLGEASDADLAVILRVFAGVNVRLGKGAPAA